MGSSLILTGGVATAKTLREVITQPAHGFAVGDVLRWDAGSAKYRLAMADSAENAEVVGVVDTVDDASNFKLVYSGYLDVSTLAGITVPVLFLSGASAGKLVTTPPSSIGSVIKPVLTKANNTNGYVLTNYLGTQIGGSSTIAIDEIQPVGTIMPFAGTSIPDTWLPCEGNAYSIDSYPELYSKLCYADGARVPMYGHIVELTLSAIPSGTAVGEYVLLPKDGAVLPSASTASDPEPSAIQTNMLIEGNITAIDTINNKITVKTTWRYNSTKKYFEYPNAAFKPATNYTIINGASWVTGNFRGTINGITVTAVRLTHFLTPDLKSRFIVGSADTGFNAQPEDATYSSASLPEDNSRGTTYAQGAFGGEEKHTLTIAEMPAHKHKSVDWGGSQFAPSGTQYDLANVANGNYGFVS